MGLLTGKNALIFGVANKHSIAWAIAQAFHAEGANVALSYAVPQLERRVRPLAAEIDCTHILQCNVNEDSEIDTLFQTLGESWEQIDILVHAVAFAEREDLNGRFVETSRSGFKTALEISAYSLIALSRRAAPLMTDGGTVLTLSYYGAEKVIPKYNVMGVAKAALEASVRYLAADLGPDGIRVNAISAGPIKTLASAGFGGFRKMLRYTGERTPLRRNVNQGDVAKTALWLCSDLGSGVTGETIYVDAGYHILGMPEPPENWE